MKGAGFPIPGVLITVVLAGLLVVPAFAGPTLVLSPSSGKDGTRVTATGSSFDLFAVEFPQATILFNGEVVARNVWLTGSGFTTTFEVPPGTPPGSYRVQAIGPRDTATATFTVASPPVAGFTMDPSSGMGRVPLTVSFIDMSTGNPGSWRWQFGDGSTSPLQNAVHDYPYAGTYTATLTVSNAGGGSSYSRTVTVYRPELVLSPGSGKAGTRVTVAGSSFGLYGQEPGTATVTFGSISAPASVPMTRNGNLGSFTTSFTVPSGTPPGDYFIRAAGPMDSAETRFTVTNMAPHALIDASPAAGRTPLSVHFSGGRSYDEDGSIGSYRWSFGDDTSAVGAASDHTYPRPGDYHVVLTVTDNEQQPGTASLTIRAENTPPVAVARASPTYGSSPLTVTFDGSQSYDPDGDIASYRWDFGDGDLESSAIARHQYVDVQSYTAVLTVTDDKGAKGSGEIPVTVGNEPPVAALSVSPDHGPSPLSVTLDGSQSRDPDNPNLTYTWDFGDGESGAGIATGHTYAKEGTFRVSLLVADPHGASGRAEATVRVEPPFPWVILVLAVAFSGIALICRHCLRLPGRAAPTGELPAGGQPAGPEVHVEAGSGVECPAIPGKEMGQLPDISVVIRSGILKEGDKE